MAGCMAFWPILVTLLRARVPEACGLHEMASRERGNWTSVNASRFGSKGQTTRDGFGNCLFSASHGKWHLL